MEQQEPQGLMGWLKESITVKIAFIGILTLALLIPSAWIGELIRERSARQDEMMADVSNKWSGSQLIQGPVLVIPYKKAVKVTVNGKDETRTLTENIYVLPNDLNVNADIQSETLHRGIFDAVVYNTKVNISGNFMKAELDKLSIGADQLLPEKAKLTFSISDLKGLKTNPVIKIAGQTLSAEPAFSDPTLFSNGLQAAINLTGLTDKAIPFNFTLDLKGSQAISFLHTGKTTTVNVKSNWPSPSFDGRYLPDSRHVDKSGFAAKWRMLYYNRPFPQQWTENDTLLNAMQKKDEAVFGVKLHIPVDQYQQTTRTSKYSSLIILLTFISLFLTEIIGKYKVHVFNYILIGFAMTIYYILLLSFSEQIGYTPAYMVASTATIALITIFIVSLLKNGRAAIMFAFILSLFYTFIYIIIQLEDYALLVGSIALFIIIAALMYFSRKINWDKH